MCAIVDWLSLYFLHERYFSLALEAFLLDLSELGKRIDLTQPIQA